MNKYYAVVRSNSELRHYGVIGMHWGIRKHPSEKRMIKRINKNSNSQYGTYSSNYTDHSQGFFSAPNGGKKSNRYQLWEKMASEYSKAMNGHDQDGGKKANKNWKKISKKYQRAYLEAVLKDSKLPVNEKNIRFAHDIISKKDKEYARYNKKL